MVTEFQKRVYDEVRKIPRGQVATYGEIARRIGCGSARAVGQALKVNPFAPDVPCHRVVAANGALTGFYGRCDAVALAKKRRMLEAEGIKFKSVSPCNRAQDWRIIYPNVENSEIETGLGIGSRSRACARGSGRWP